MVPDEKYLLKLVRARMPFGKYQGQLLIDLPEAYIVWFAQKGFPKGSLGDMLKSVYEIKLNGLEGLLEPLREGNMSTVHGRPPTAKTRKR
jgi:Uncharacterized protein conserved in bacteria